MTNPIVAKQSYIHILKIWRKGRGQFDPFNEYKGELVYCVYLVLSGITTQDKYETGNVLNQFLLMGIVIERTGKKSALSF